MTTAQHAPERSPPSMSPPNIENSAAPNAGTVSQASSGDTHAVPYPQRAAAAGDPSHSAPPPEVGTVVGTFVLQDKLGEGVSCHVFRGWDQSRSCPVALKILNWANVYDRTAAMKQLRME